jgi:hypothetical protein
MTDKYNKTYTLKFINYDIKKYVNIIRSYNYTDLKDSLYIDGEYMECKNILYYKDGGTIVYEFDNGKFTVGQQLSKPYGKHILEIDGVVIIMEEIKDVELEINNESSTVQTPSSCK